MQGSANSPQPSEQDLAELEVAMPHLAAMLGSGTGSPVGSPGCSGAELLLTAPFSLGPDHFPDLPPDTVADVISRHDRATAMKHLMMWVGCGRAALDGCGASRAAGAAGACARRAAHKRCSATAVPVASTAAAPPLSCAALLRRG